jgi:hypothetical protein
VKLVGRIPVEPLDDERLTNIERRVVAGAVDAAPRHRARARTPRRDLAFAAAAMAAMVAGVVGWKLGVGTTAAPIVAEAAPTPIHVTTDARRSSLDIGDATIQSDPSTAFVVTRPSGGVLVEMSRGKVELEVAKRANRPPLVVRAGDTDVIVVGTHFTVDYGDGTGDVDVRVTEGVVEVVRHEHKIRVAAGSAWKTRVGVIALADAGPGLTVATAAGTTAAGTAAGATAGTDPVALEDDPAHAGGGSYEIDMGKAPDVLHERTSQVPDARTPSTQHATNPGSNETTDRRISSRDLLGKTAVVKPHTVDDPKDPRGDIKRSVRQQPVAPALDVGEPDAAKAMARYNEKIRNHEDESGALYSIAVIQATKLGRTADALRTLEAFERRFAQGKIPPEKIAVLWLRVRILCGRAIDDSCRQAAYTYVHQAPDSPASHLARRITISE